MRGLCLLTFYCLGLQGQWDVLRSNTQASFRGVHNTGHGVVWISGTEGTVLRSMDEGRSWQRCTVPPGAANLDFRGIQGLDRNTAVVMSSGPGELSRVYKTTDGCRSWKRVFTNPDSPDGFFDAVQFDGSRGFLIGDPIRGAFALFESRDGGDTWKTTSRVIAASDQEGLFAASNSSMILRGRGPVFVTGGPRSRCLGLTAGADLPFAHGTSAGAFSIAVGGKSRDVLVAVGGDYQHPDEATGTSATSRDGGLHWNAAEHPVHGYRSAVAYDPALQLWVAVGPNGTDVSIDDGRTWSAYAPHPGEAADADKQWNAISLPFAVGPKGRIGRWIDRGGAQ